MRYLSVCSGMEAASVAWHPLGWTPVGFSEIEPFPCAILKHRFPNVPNYGSLTEYQSWPIEPGAIDLLVGGTPCQSFSVAGLRKGLADPRGNLALVFLGLADKLKPKWIVWENVPGVLSSGGGRDFGSFLGALVELGYGFAYRVLDAQHFGVPQRRRRVFVVACLGDWRAPAEVLSLREGLRGYLEAGGKKRKGVAADAGNGVEASGLRDTVGTLDTECGGGKLTHQSAISGHVIPFRKSKRAQSTTDNETRVPADVTNTLNNFDLGDTRTTHAVVSPIQDGREMDKKQNGLGIGQVGDPAYTLDTTGAQAIAIQGTIIGRSENADPQGTGATEGGPMFTLTKTDIHGVAHCSNVAPTVTSSGPPYSRTGNERVEAEALVAQPIYENSRRDAIRIYEGTSPTLQSFMGTGGCNVPMVQQGVDLYNQTITGDVHVPLRTAGGHGAPACMTPMAVRRLTPVECERLQGFPDNWSRIPWKGKPETECPDGPRYKACGNSMAVPVMRWIGERIHNYELSQNHEAK